MAQDELFGGKDYHKMHLMGEGPGAILSFETFLSPGGSEVKASACKVGDLGSIPGSGRSPGEGKDKLFCLQSLVLVNYTTQFKLCTRDYTTTIYPA